jgi:hypothetical protein
MPEGLGILLTDDGKQTGAIPLVHISLRGVGQPRLFFAGGMPDV